MSKLVLIEATHPLDEESHYISLGYLASYLSKYYGDIEIVVKRSTGDLDIALKDGDMVGITAFTQNYNSALRVAKSAKTINSSVPVIIGGLATATLVTLLVLPILYPWFDQEPPHSPVPDPAGV